MALREELANDCNFQKMSSISCGAGRSRQFHVLKEGEQDEEQAEEPIFILGETEEKSTLKTGGEMW